MTGWMKKEFEADWKGTLRKLKDMGYVWLEGNYWGNSAEAYSREARKMGLKPICGGTSMTPLSKNLDKYLRQAEDMQFEYLVCYYPWMFGNDQINLSSSYDTADQLNRVGKSIHEAGFRFAWHPHNWEFFSMEEGKRPIDVLMEHTDPQIVDLELDLYWIAHAGVDPLALMRQYPDRIKLLHVKDLAPEPEKEVVCAGEGTIDLKAIFETAHKVGVEYWFVEMENGENNLPCAKTSIDYIQSIL